MKSRLWPALLVAATLIVPVSVGAAEAPYPSKPITFVIPVDAGSDGDVLARPMLQKASTILGAPIVVVNRPGGGSSIGYRQVHDSKPDGYTIGWGAATVATNKLQGILPYDHNDFTLVGGYARIVPVLFASTRTERPFKSIDQVFSHARANPGKVSLATSGVGMVWWFAARALEETTSIQFNIIPQPGGAGYTVTQVAGGHVDVGIMGLGPAKAQLAARNIELLGVLGSRRAPAPYDNVPSLSELGYTVNVDSTHFVLGPPKMPTEVVDKLVKAFEAAAHDKEYREFLVKADAMPVWLTPAQVQKSLDEQRLVYRSIMQKAGILKE